MQNPARQIVDEILVMDAQRGRREAFETLVSRWQKRLWWHACHEQESRAGVELRDVITP